MEFESFILRAVSVGLCQCSENHLYADCREDFRGIHPSSSSVLSKSFESIVKLQKALKGLLGRVEMTGNFNQEAIGE